MTRSKQSAAWVRVPYALALAAVFTLNAVFGVLRFIKSHDVIGWADLAVACAAVMLVVLLLQRELAHRKTQREERSGASD